MTTPVVRNSAAITLSLLALSFSVIAAIRAFAACPAEHVVHYSEGVSLETASVVDQDDENLRDRLGLLEIRVGVVEKVHANTNTKNENSAPVEHPTSLAESQGGRESELDIRSLVRAEMDAWQDATELERARATALTTARNAVRSGLLPGNVDHAKFAEIAARLVVEVDALRGEFGDGLDLFEDDPMRKGFKASRDSIHSRYLPELARLTGGGRAGQLFQYCTPYGAALWPTETETRAVLAEAGIPFN